MFFSNIQSIFYLFLLSFSLSSCIYEPPQSIPDPDPFDDEDCLPEARTSCAGDGDLYWVDSCGRRGEKQSECPPEYPCIAGPPARCSIPPSESCIDILDLAEAPTELLDFGPKMIGNPVRKQITIESCGDQVLVITGITLSGDESFSLPSLPTFPLLIEMGERLTLDIDFLPNDVRLHQAQLSVQSDDLAHPEKIVRLSGLGLLDPCPQPAVIENSMVVSPLEVVSLDASPSLSSEDNEIGLHYEWVVLSRPPGSISQPVESFYQLNAPADGGVADDSSTPQALFFVDLVGEYLIELQLVDPTGYRVPSSECGESRLIEISSQTESAIHIELTWRTPLDIDESDSEGSDLDLHLLHPLTRFWNDEEYDCFYGNRIPDWGERGPNGNPSLDIDDTNGAGPENINLNQPDDTHAFMNPYLIGIHFYNDHLFGSAEAQVRVFLLGELESVFTRILLASEHFWIPAAIHWTEERQWSELIDEYYQLVP